MRADGHALQTLDARLLVPHRNFQREIALFVLRRRGRERAVVRERADRQIVAVAAGDFAENIAHKLRRVRRDRRKQRAGAVDFVAAHRDFVQMRQRVVHGLQIHLDDFIALLAVGFLDGILDRVNRLVLRQHAGQREETDLHDGVDASAHAAVARDLGGVNDVEFRLLREQGLLHRRWQRGPNLVFANTACSAKTCRRAPGCGASRSVQGTSVGGTR